MFKNLLLLATTFILIACGGSSRSTAITEETIPSTILNDINISTWMYQIQSLDDSIDILDDTDYDMLVVEPGFNFKEDAYDTQRIVSSLSYKPNGDKRLLLAYIDIVICQH